ncbi:MAG TPA: WYL domain-containing protein [Polyangiaceae bacterium]|nr:WYL domain-containing protein [Polyangiaceae bacterium]
MTRFARVARAIPILALHPAGMRLSDLATQLGTSEDELREEIRAYYQADVPPGLSGAYREPVIEFVAGPLPGDDEEYPDFGSAAYVRLRDLRTGVDVGAKFLSLGELTVVSRAGHDLLSEESDNDVLESALAKLDDSVLDGFDRGGPRWLGDRARVLREAARDCRRARIVYARAWHPGVVERVIEPYRVLHTRRGWEVDAAVVGRDGAIRTYLVSGIRELEVLDETFSRPEDAAELAAANRQLQAVEVVVPQGARWAVELYAESAELLAEDEDSVKLRALLLRPVEQRLGLLLMAAGTDAFVVSPSELADAARELARNLLNHHR